MTTPPRTPLDVDRSKACPLDLDCYCFQGHPGEHMYYSRSAAQLAREAPAPDPAPLDVERLARAFWSVTRERFAASPLVPDLPEWRDPSIDAATWDKSVSDAAEVAREYAKLW